MSIEEIEKRLKIGYTMAVYGTTDNIIKQLKDDLTFLLSNKVVTDNTKVNENLLKENEGLKKEISKLLKSSAEWMNSAIERKKENEELEKDRDIYKKMSESRRRIMNKWIKDYNLPIEFAELDNL